MNNSKPLIGVTGPEKGGTSAWIFTAIAVWLQGGKPVRIHPSKRVEAARLDGLILGGGADINPQRYGELLEQTPENQPKPKGLRSWVIKIISILLYPVLFLLRNIFSTKSPDSGTARDGLEFKLLDDACKRQIPVLGICRGAQLINVQFGGTLHQDIEGFYTEIPKVHTIWPREMVSIQQGSALHKMTGSGDAWVNALHHQAVDNLGEPLKVTARDRANIIQAIEHPGYPYLIGVQWHPEYLPQIIEQRNIFKALVKRASEVRRKM
jgi:putative glutamine amidotransferase